jgi:cellulose biosynthesis protein BcsQ
MSLVTFFSVKGGVGVTSCVANAAVYLARMGLTVTAVDLSGTEQLKVLLGVAPDQPVLGSPRQTVEVGQQHGIRIASAPSNLSSPEDRVNFLQAISGVSEVVVADLSSLDVASYRQIGAHGALNVCLLSADAGSINSLPRAIDEQRVIPNIRFVINNVDQRRRVAVEAMSLFEAALGSAIIGSVRRDEALNEATASMEPLASFAPTTAAARDLSVLANAINSVLPALLTHIS